MVFSATNLFKGTACPENSGCKLANCIFSHDESLLLKAQQTAQPVSRASTTLPSHQAADEPNEPAHKKRKVTYNSLAEKPPSRADLIRSQLAASKASPRTSSQDLSQSPAISGAPPPPPQSLVKPVTPPPTNGKASGAVGSRLSPSAANSNNNHTCNAPGKVESLNPRLVSNDPVGHSKRQLFLKHLHAEIQRLNQRLSDAPERQDNEKYLLSPQQTVKMALDLEQKIIHDSGPVYSNILKQRISAFRKLMLEDWKHEVKMTFFAKDEDTVPKPAKHTIDTGLSLENEALILPQLVSDQKPLAAYGYVPVPPTAEEIAEAKAAVQISQNWEICDRCSARFQTFPDRNAEGLLSGNGPCRFHPNRKMFPQRTKTDKETGPKEPYYPCCNDPVGSPGCTLNTEHVFKTSSPARLAAVLPFINTPENPSPAVGRDGKKPLAVTFDCEMGYTALGLELIRMTAVAWPTGDQLVDVLVRPLGGIIDLNSRFSGVFSEHYGNAIPYDQWEDYKPSPSSNNDTVRLPIVESPQKARELLCSFLTPQTPLIGHAIDNDLNTVRLCHPTIIDTVLLFPHPRGLPMRYGLKMLSMRHLHRSIQTGGNRGHDSLEDAIATGDLVRVKVGMEWKELQRKGYRIIGGNKLLPPSPQSQQLEREEKPASPSAKASAGRLVGHRDVKRKRKRRSSVDTDGAEDSSDGESPTGTASGGVATL